jgi:LPXTG-motif cell wall-anchored protein
MNYSKYRVSLVLISSLFVSQAFAADAVPASPTPTTTIVTPGLTSETSTSLNVIGAPKLVTQTATSVTLEWNKVSAAKSYIVKYSKTSVAEAFKSGKTNAIYDMESDQVTATGTTIKELKTDTTYYFAIVALDAANNESATNSEELAVTLTGVKTPTATGATVPVVSDFKLSGVTVVDATNLTLDFSAALGKDPVVLKLVKSSNAAAAAVVKSVSPGKAPNQAVVLLSTPLDPSSSYSLVVIAAKDIEGNSISKGLNAVKEFATSVNLVKTAAATTPSLSGALVGSGTTLSGALATNAEAIGSLNAAPALPATGTQETLLLIFAAIISFGIVFFVRSRRA